MIEMGLEFALESTPDGASTIPTRTVQNLYMKNYYIPVQREAVRGGVKSRSFRGGKLQAGGGGGGGVARWVWSGWTGEHRELRADVGVAGFVRSGRRLEEGLRSRIEMP